MSPEEIALRIGRMARSPEPGRALAAIEPGLDRFPPHPDIALALSELYLAARRPREALDWSGRALERGAEQWRARLQLGVSALENGDRTRARREVLQASTRAGGDAGAQCLCGAVLSRLGAQREALACYRKAERLRPGDAAVQFSLASVERFLGNLDAAGRHCEQTLRLDPGAFEAYLLRAGLRRATPASNHIPQLRQRLAGPLPDAVAEAQLCYALAKELEDCGDYTDSFTCLRRGATARRRAMDYDPRPELVSINDLIARCDASALAPGAPADQGAGAIFILGLPRSGSTLLERLLCAHSRIGSGGELPDFPRLLTLARGRRDAVEAALAMDPGPLGRDYLAASREQRAAQPFLIDKLPLNFLNVGLIHRALPAAHLIHIRREPMDHCYAMYKTLFRDGYPFSYDLDELAQYYLAYRRLMDHWNRVLPRRLIEVDYETLVADPVAATGDVLARLELQWETPMADFHRQATPSSTASASQVREPVHRRSVGLWRHYREHLQPLRNRLAAGGVAITDGAHTR